MKPIYLTEIERCQSSFDGALMLQEIQSKVSKIIESRSYKKILDSQVPLYVSIVANPNSIRVKDLQKLENNIYLQISTDIENDYTIYSIVSRFSTITLPQSVESCLIGLSTKNISEQSGNENTTKTDEESIEFIAQTSSVTFDDLILSNEIKERLLRALAIIKNRDLIFDTWNFKKIDKATKSILCFYGPAGTGKTETAKAVGSYLGKKIIFSSYAQIESQYVGVGAKNLHAIFKAAEMQDALLFFDEADSFLSNRLSKTESSSDKHYNRMSNELFQLLENFNGCVIFATNLLTDVDNAFKSRIIDSIRFELPDEEARLSIIKLMIPNEFPLSASLTEEEYSRLIDLSNGFSGRDIRKAILLTLARASTLSVSSEKLVFDVEDIAVGFENVKKSKQQMDEEINGIEIDPAIGQELLDSQIFKEKLVTIAKLALNVESAKNIRAKNIYRELTYSILGVASENIELQDDETIQSVCCNITEKQKIELLDVAIKVLTVDGYLSDREREFLQDVMANCSITKATMEQICSYADSMAQANSTFINIETSMNK